MVHLPDHLDPSTVAAGCDEAGRGCLAGPVFAAAVILPAGHEIEGLNDSKKLSETARVALRSEIQQSALAWAVARFDPSEIDRLNILWASVGAMHKALDQLDIRPEYVLVDGNRFKSYRDIPHECIVKGDGKIASIAAASILAKTYRDEYMVELHSKHPDYAWRDNKGYPTVQHRKAIMAHGATPHHRRSFRLLPDSQKDLFD